MEKMLGQTLSSCQSFLRIVETIALTRFADFSQRHYSLSRNHFIYRLKNNLMPKNLKLFHLPILIMFVLLVGCATSRSISTHSPARDNIEQSDVGVILSLADFHFDPFYDPKLFRALVEAPPSEWTTIFESSQVSGYGEYGKDSNYNLVVSALKHAALAVPRPISFCWRGIGWPTVSVTATTSMLATVIHAGSTSSSTRR